jgi:hypothetical protein
MTALDGLRDRRSRIDARELPLPTPSAAGYDAAVREDLDELKEGTRAAVLSGPGMTSVELRQALARGEPPEDLRALVETIRRHAYKVTDEDIAALRARYSEDQVFEIVVATIVGAADERLRAGLRALEEA